MSATATVAAAAVVVVVVVVVVVDDDDGDNDATRPLRDLCDSTTRNNDFYKEPSGR